MIIETRKELPFTSSITVGAYGRGWRTMRYDLERSADVARYVARERYSWPGGYELFALTDDGGVLCCDCCRSEYWHIAHSSRGDGWHVVAMDSAANSDEPLSCDHCDRSIIPDDDESEAQA